LPHPEFFARRLQRNEPLSLLPAGHARVNWPSPSSGGSKKRGRSATPTGRSVGRRRNCAARRPRKWRATGRPGGQSSPPAPFSAPVKGQSGRFSGCRHRQPDLGLRRLETGGSSSAAIPPEIEYRRRDRRSETTVMGQHRRWNQSCGQEVVDTARRRRQRDPSFVKSRP
jgi:hypothetical protein